MQQQAFKQYIKEVQNLKAVTLEKIISPDIHKIKYKYT